MSPEEWPLRTLPEIASALRHGHLSAEALTGAYIGRIRALDRSGPDSPGLQSVLSINPQALEAAAEADRKVANGEPLGPLHGLPVLLKDNIETAEQATTAGAVALSGNTTGRDSDIAQSLRKAGAILLGKTNLSEWANYRARRIVSGWSSLGGQTRNPHVLDRSPCGSSSGSAVAVAASLAAGAIGTETLGSIICPAHVNGVVGFKPSAGAVSMKHVIPLLPSQDIAGPMATSVHGAAILFSAMSGQAQISADPAQTDIPMLEGLRFGILTSATGQVTALRDLFSSAVDAIRVQGGACIPIPEIGVAKSDFMTQYQQVLSDVFPAALASYLSDLPPAVRVRTLQDLVASNEQTPGSRLDLFGQDLLEEAARRAPINGELAEERRKALSNAAWHQGVRRLLETHDVDVLIAPSGPIAPPTDFLNGDVSPDNVGISWLAAIAGCPHLTIPMGTVRGVPVGLSLIGARHADISLLRIGAIVEQVVGRRPEPGYLNTIRDAPTGSAR
ncbi:MAG TPA: amidase family protein [Hyphomonas sp.]|nr:amidase family protein [Hyphomonas sp.]